MVLVACFGSSWTRSEAERKILKLKWLCSPYPFPIDAYTRARILEIGRIFLILQVAEEDYPKVKKGFGLIGDSLTRESKPNMAE